MDPSRVETIRGWEFPTTIRELQVFLGFTNFYRRFIAGYSRIARPLTERLKGGITNRQVIELTEEEREAFQRLKDAFMEAPLLVHFDPEKAIRRKTDASGFAAQRS
jgi:hypothetical protein